MALSFKQSLAYFWEQIGKQFLKNGKEVEYNVLLPKTTLENIDGTYILPTGAIDKIINNHNYTIIYNEKPYYCTSSIIPLEVEGIYLGILGNPTIMETVVGMPLEGDHNAPFGIFLALDADNNIQESLVITYDDATGVALEILDDAVPAYLTKNLNNELVWTQREFYDWGDIITPVIKEGYIETDMDGAYLRGEQLGIIQAGNTYIVDTDYGSYECEAWKFPESIIQQYAPQFQELFRYVTCLGSSNANMLLFPNTEGLNIDIDIPFTLAFMPPEFGLNFIALVDTAADFITENVNITTKKANVKKLDPKYIHKPDWNLPSEAPGGILNKTHGCEYEYHANILSTIDVFNITEEEIEQLISQPLGLIEGETYTVRLNENNYILTANSISVEGMEIIYIGDLVGAMNGQWGDIPFAIMELTDGMAINGTNMKWQPILGPIEASECIVSITGTKRTLKKLDNIFINWPDWMPELNKVSQDKYIDYTGISWEWLESVNKYLTNSNYKQDFLAVDWEEGSFYDFEYDGKLIKLYCSYEPGNFDTPASIILSTKTSGSVWDKVQNSQVAILINKAGTYVYIYSEKMLGRITIANKYSYTKQMPISVLQQPIFSLATGNGDNSLLTRNSQNQASGTNSIALGYCSTAEGANSFAWGSTLNPVENYNNGFIASIAGNSEAIGDCSVTFGGRSEGQFAFSTQGGYAKGMRSIAFNKSRAFGENQVTLGKYNKDDNDNKYALIIGNGTGLNTTESPNRQSNALTVNWNGNTWVKGSLFVGGTSETEGASKVATEAYVNGLIVPPVLESTAGKENAAGPIGQYASGTPGMNSFTWGLSALAAGSGSIAMGTTSTTSTSAHWGVALGTYAAAKGEAAVAIGQNVIASSVNAVAIGQANTASSQKAVAIGNNLTANYTGQIVLGTYNLTGNYSLLLGNGTGNGRSNAFGVTSTGTGYFAGDLYVNGTGTSSTFSNAKKVATESYVDTKVAGLVDSAPGTLDTLNELAAALGDDPNFATTVATEIGKKADKTDLVALTEAEILEVCGVAAVAHISEVTW